MGIYWGISPLKGLPVGGFNIEVRRPLHLVWWQPYASLQCIPCEGHRGLVVGWRVWKSLKNQRKSIELHIYIYIYTPSIKFSLYNYLCNFHWVTHETHISPNIGSSTSGFLEKGFVECLCRSALRMVAEPLVARVLLGVLTDLRLKWAQSEGCEHPWCGHCEQWARSWDLRRRGFPFSMGTRRTT